MPWAPMLTQSPIRSRTWAPPTSAPAHPWRRSSTWRPARASPARSSSCGPAAVRCRASTATCSASGGRGPARARHGDRSPSAARAGVVTRGRARGQACFTSPPPCHDVLGRSAMTVSHAAGTAPLTDRELESINAYWRASNYLSVGQIYLLANPLLREPLKLEHVKPRLLGHWGTTPGLNFLYVHMNRAIVEHDLNAIYITGPGHGGPGLVAQTWLEGSYTELYHHVGQDEEGMRRLFRQFSFPGGVPSHVAPETPGSIHEGGELGYALVHAYGAAFDNPDLLVCAVVGDGEAETGPLAASWHSNKFVDPRRDGAVLPILHLNGYKIANPTLLARIPHDDLTAFFEGHGHKPHFVEGSDPAEMHQLMAATLDKVLEEIRGIQHAAREEGHTGPVRWPMIVLISPKGWTGPKEVDGEITEGSFRSHQVPLSGLAQNPDHLALLEQWLKSYRPEELFDETGAPIAELRALAPKAERGMGRTRTPTAACCCRTSSSPTSAPTRSTCRGRRP